MNWHFSSVAGAAYKKLQHAVVKELYTALAHLSNMQDAQIAAAMHSIATCMDALMART